MNDRSDKLLALDDLTVVEFADLRGEFLGKLLAGMGARVIKVEPPGGSPSRRYGPYYQDVPHPERSLCYWHYNQGKQGITLNAEARDGRALLAQLVRKADVLIETARPGYLAERGLDYPSLELENPGLIGISITDFGQSGPWRDYKGSDIVFLALGGQMMMSGYAPRPDGTHDTPPIAPQVWQSVHIAGSMAAFDLLAALWHRRRTGRGQHLDYSLHAATNAFTENWLARYLTDGTVSPRRPQFGGDLRTRDGFSIVAQGALFPEEWDREAALLAEGGGQGTDLKDPRYKDSEYRARHAERIGEVRRAFVAERDGADLFVEAQHKGVIWAPVLSPEAGLSDAHFAGRGNFAQVEHPELGKSFIYPGAPWIAERMPWRNGTRAPLLGEHNLEIYEGLLGIDRPRLIALAQAGAI